MSFLYFKPSSVCLVLTTIQNRQKQAASQKGKITTLWKRIRVNEILFSPKCQMSCPGNTRGCLLAGKAKWYILSSWWSLNPHTAAEQISQCTSRVPVDRIAHNYILAKLWRFLQTQWPSILCISEIWGHAYNPAQRMLFPRRALCAWTQHQEWASRPQWFVQSTGVRGWTGGGEGWD